MLPVAFNAVFTLSRLSFYGQLLGQLKVSSLSRPTVFFHSVTVYLGQINDDDDDSRRANGREPAYSDASPQFYAQLCVHQKVRRKNININDA